MPRNRPSGRPRASSSVRIPAPGAVVNSSLTANLTGAIGVADQPSQRPCQMSLEHRCVDAAAILTKYGFRSGRISDDDDANVAAGTVVTQNPRAVRKHRRERRSR